MKNSQLLPGETKHEFINRVITAVYAIPPAIKAAQILYENGVRDADFGQDFGPINGAWVNNTWNALRDIEHRNPRT